jgi:selenocysteine lyase/cysteine desulfurase
LVLSRRDAVGALGALLPALVAARASAARPVPAPATGGDFALEGTYLDAAFIHPFGGFALDAATAYAQAKHADPQAVGPVRNARRIAVERFARLIGAQPKDIAVVPSTMDGENLVNATLRIGPGRGVVTDALHYDASLALYGEQRRRGAPVGIALPRVDGRIDLADIRALITRETRLIAVSLVSSSTGFTHDLAELCALAHAHDVLVYADIIQAAGAVPIDVRASGVDFACCGTYKWLMGDFGTAFLYIRPDRLDRLTRVQTGWRQIRRQGEHGLPFDPPGSPLDDYTLASDAVGFFELSTPAWGALAVAGASLDHVASIGVAEITRRRQPLLDRLHDGLPRKDFQPLTVPGAAGPIISFAVRDAAKRFGPPLQAARIKISTYDNRIRIAPSVYNDTDDIDRLLAILTRG